MLGAILIIAFMCLMIFFAGPTFIELYQDTMEEWKDALKINKEDQDA